MTPPRTFKFRAGADQWKRGRDETRTHHHWPNAGGICEQYQDDGSEVDHKYPYLYGSLVLRPCNHHNSQEGGSNVHASEKRKDRDFNQEQPGSIEALTIDRNEQSQPRQERQPRRYAPGYPCARTHDEILL